MKYKYILFDLDGTLTDSAEGITKSLAHALKHFQIEVEDLSELRHFIGPTLEESFGNHYNFSKEDIEVATEIFRQRFASVGKFENRLYEGVKGMLKELKARGRRLYVATSKPTIYAQEILDYFQIAHYFEGIIGSEISGERSEKGEVIAYALKHFPIDKDQAIMVGDRKYDVCGARDHGLNTVGVLYGFGDRLELESHGAMHLVESVGQLESFLLAEG